MQLASQRTLPVSQAQAWDALNDVAMLQAAIPGCEQLVATDAHRYDVVVQVAVGPVKARFKGRLQLEDLQPPEAYRLRFEGQGGAAGHGKGTAQVRLEPVGPAETVLHYEAQATVGGKIAQVGSRLVDLAAQKVAGEFFDAFEAALRARYAPPAVETAVAVAVAEGPPSPAGGGSRLLAWFRAWIARLLRR